MYVKSVAADGKTEIHSLPGVGLVVSAVAFNGLVSELRESLEQQKRDVEMILLLSKNYRELYNMSEAFVNKLL